ncbi:hypothetical protein ABMA27_015621 [Loxostege sticticalis]|uniref:Cytochrome P450 n=1 Tax=Loxostege sticticalis TaxID=481309 RepID=A0ABR3I8E8_LOXSC
MLVQFFIAITVIWILVIRWNNRHKRKLAEELSNNLQSWPIVGHALLFLGSNEDRTNTLCKIGKECYRRGGSTCFWLVNKLVVMFADAEDAEVILKTCLDKNDLNVKSLVGHGSIFAPVPIWRPRRKILAPHFNLKSIMNFMDVHSRQGRILADTLKTSVGTGVVSLWDYTTAYTMDAIGETILGTKLDAQQHGNHPFPKAFLKFCELQAVRVIQPWLDNDFLYKLLPCGSVYFSTCELMKNFVEQNKFRNNHNISQNDKYRPKAMIESFIETAEYTEIEMHEEALVLVLAGTDTSAVGLSFMILLLSRHQDVQEKLYNELQEYYGDSNRPVSWNDLPQLKYLEAVTKESLRLYPPVPMISREVKRNTTLPSGRTLVPGVVVFVNIWAIHRNPQYWGADAEEFRPERFLERELVHPAAYMPFSRGPRNCLGSQYASMSMKTALIYLMRNYKFLAPPDNECKNLNVKFQLMLKHADNFRVQIESRH